MLPVWGLARESFQKNNKILDRKNNHFLKKIAVHGDFFVWSSFHLQTSYNWHLKAKKERNRILKKDIYLDDYDDDIEYG